jgi:hypothetical protein
MKRNIILVALILSILVPLVYGAQYISKLGSHDLEWGTGTWVDNNGRTRYRINAGVLPFSQDNTVMVGSTNLYRLAGYVLGTWKIPYLDGSGLITSVALDNAGLCLKSGGVASAPVWGPCGGGSGGGTGGGDVLIDSGYYLYFGPSSGLYSMYYSPGSGKLILRSTNSPNTSFSIDNNSYMYITAPLEITSTRVRSVFGFDNSAYMVFGQYGSYVPGYIGANGIYRERFDSSTSQLKWETNLSGSTMAATDPAYLFSFSDNGVSSTGQRVWGVRVNGTVVFYVDEAGNITGKSFNSSVAEGHRDFNDSNDGCNYLGVPVSGTTWYNPCLKARLTYDGQYWRVQSSFISVPANENTVCTQGQITATDNWLYVCVGTSAPYWKTTHFDNVFRQTYHGDNVAGVGGGGTPPDNIVYSDNFNRANETPIGGNWSMIAWGGGGGVNLENNHVTVDNGTGNDHNQYAFRNSESYLDNQWSRGKMVHNPATIVDAGGPAVRMQYNGTGQNGYIVSFDNTDTGSVWAMYADPVTWEQVGTNYTGLTLSANDNITLSITGNVLTLKVNDVSKGNKTDTNNRVPSGGTPGFTVKAIGSNWDNWSGGSN